MKQLLLSVLLLTAFSQDINVNAQVSAIDGIINRLLGGVKTLLDSTVNDVVGLIASLDPTVTNLVGRVLATVFNLVDNLLALVNGLLAGARGSDRSVDHCANLSIALELVKSQTSMAVEECRNRSDARLASVSADLKAEQDRGSGLISRATDTTRNCVIKGLQLVTECILNAQKSAVREIQGIVVTVRSLTQRISLDEVSKCLDDAEENGRQSANQIYQEIEQCVSRASRRR